MSLEPQFVETLDELSDMIIQFKIDAKYVGATKRPEERPGEHEISRGYVGTWFYTNSSDMKIDENALLEVCFESGQCEDNKKRKSGLPDKEVGFVYVIDVQAINKPK